ncbi:MAG: FAD-dependent oxidoreductase [Solirubrobacterales bacterium]|nr:FAD-dependent oxidoreductase [Solirubrobacterales bacterium]
MDAADRFDVVVVGSGFGGAVTACRLAEAGRRVLVLERGRPWAPGSFPRTPHDFQKAFWDPVAGRHGLFDVWAFHGLNAVTASGLGGGSLIYANVMLRKPAEGFADAGGGAGPWPLTREDLDPHYDRVAAVQQPVPYPLEHPAYAATGKATALAEAAAAMGLEACRPPLAVRFAATEGGEPRPRAPIHEPLPNLHGVPRSTCRLCGECDIGCNDGAKQTLDLTYLTRAQAAGAQLRTLCDAQTLEPGDDGGWRVGYRQHVGALDGVPAGLRDPQADPRRVVAARHVVLAAGTMGTVRLLLRNRTVLPHLSPAVGHRVSGNGDQLGFVRGARRGGPGDEERPWRYLDPSHGPVITTSVRVPAERSSCGREHYVQDGGAPAFTEWLWHALEVPEAVWGERHQLTRRLRDRMSGHHDANLSDELARLLGSGHMSAAMMPLLGMGLDVADGRLYLDQDGRLELEWEDEQADGHYAALAASSQALAAAMGATWSRAPARHLTTVHPVGGCAMAEDPAHGVVDPGGNVWGHPGLHVADGSVLPGPVGPNPSFTIAAVADRFADAMLQDGRA